MSGTFTGDMHYFLLSLSRYRAAGGLTPRPAHLTFKSLWLRKTIQYPSCWTKHNLTSLSIYSPVPFPTWQILTLHRTCPSDTTLIAVIISTQPCVSKKHMLWGSQRPEFISQLYHLLDLQHQFAHLWSRFVCMHLIGFWWGVTEMTQMSILVHICMLHRF